MFKLPEDLSQLTIDELQSLRAEAEAEAQAIANLADDEITDEKLTELRDVVAAVDSLESTIADVEAAAAARAEELAALRGKVQSADDAVQPGEEETNVEEEQPETDETADVPEKEREAVAASAKRISTGAVARRAPAVIIHDPEPEVAPKAQLVASANVPGRDTGSEYVDLNEVAQGFMDRARGFAGRTDDGWDRYGVAKIAKPAGEFALDDRMSLDEQMKVINEASQESRLPGGSLAASALVAAGTNSWCSPSETLYDFCDFNQPTDLLSIPEIQVSRGGFKYTRGPDFSALSANWGFLQTEAQAEARTEKTCYEVECPPFSEVRLDAIGFCITAGVLTNAAWPELVRRVLEMGLAAHRLKVDAYILSHIKTTLGAAIDYTEIGGATADLLGALELNATIQRAKYGFGAGTTIEVILPTWAKGIIREDLARRTGIDLLAVSDSQIATYFSVRGLSVQFISTLDPIATSGAGTGTVWPAVLNAYMYPAGAFVVGKSSVIDLDTVYDSTQLKINRYTAAFFEEGILVANTCYGGAAIAIDISDLAGRTGAANIGAAVTP